MQNFILIQKSKTKMKSILSGSDVNPFLAAFTKRFHRDVSLHINHYTYPSKLLTDNFPAAEVSPRIIQVQGSFN